MFSKLSDLLKSVFAKSASFLSQEAKAAMHSKTVQALVSLGVKDLLDKSMGPVDGADREHLMDALRKALGAAAEGFDASFVDSLHTAAASAVSGPVAAEVVPFRYHQLAPQHQDVVDATLEILKANGVSASIPTKA